MANNDELKKEIMLIRKDIISLENIIKTLVKTSENNSHIIKTINKKINEYIETSKKLKQEPKNKPEKIEKQNLEEEKYDWIEDSIEFGTK